MELESTALRTEPNDSSLEREGKVQLEIIVSKSSKSTSRTANGGSEKILVMPQDRVKTIVTKLLNNKSDLNQDGQAYMLKDREGNLLDSSQTISQVGLKRGDNVYFSIKKTDSSLLAATKYYKIILSTLVGLGLGFSLLGMSLRLLHQSPPDMFAVVIDAGSSHTSVFTYTWPATKLRGTGRVREAGSCGTNWDYRGPWEKVGISSFADSPSSVKDYILAPCLSQSLAKIPVEARASTLLRLGSTAGMRELRIRRPEAAEEIMGNITTSLRSTGINNVNVSIFPGELEGVMGWVTANYLKDVFGNFLHGVYKESPRSDIHAFAAIDWGGSSIQITVHVRNSSEADHVVQLYGQDYPLLSVSHICYGQRRAFRRHQVELLYQKFSDSGQIPKVLMDPCVPAQLKLTLQVRKLVSSPCTNTRNPNFEAEIQKLVRRNETITFIGQGDYGACKAATKKAFNLEYCKNRFQDMAGELSCFDKHQIPKPGNDTYFAFSTYWYLTNALNLTGSSDLANFQSHVSSLCSSSPLELASLKFDVPSACYTANFMETLLLDGYHFDAQSWTMIRFVKKVADAQVGWSLGYMILATNDIPSVEGSAYISLPVLMVFLILSFFFAMFAVVLMYIIKTKYKPQPQKNSVQL